jgi:hypothetical protein
MTRVRHIEDDEWLTQAGDAFPTGGYLFQHALRRQIGEVEVSLVFGDVSPTEACDLRAIGEKNRATDRDACRTARAGRLRQLGFHIAHTPEGAHKRHVSAYWADGEWDERAAERFCRAFLAPAANMEEEAHG